VAFSADGRLVLTGSYENMARLWDTASRKAVVTLAEDGGGRVLAVALSPDGRHVLTASSHGKAQLRPLFATQTLVDTTKSIVPRCLTPAQRQRFHLAPDAPRWCYSRQLWPFDDPSKNPPPPTSWDERLVAAWDWMVTKAFSQSEHPKAR
jgi:hypothetical protein